MRATPGAARRRKTVKIFGTVIVMPFTYRACVSLKRRRFGVFQTSLILREM
jgi:hypothetical protein